MVLTRKKSKTHHNKQRPVHSSAHRHHKHISKKKVNKQSFQLYKNDAGTRLVVMPTRTETATSSIFFYFKVGSKNETPEIHGISHFIEHMLFKGSPKFPNYSDISKTFDSNGISFNAYTSKEITAYHYKFLSTTENLDLICKITTEMIFNSLMRDKDISPERNVIIQEYNDGIDDIDDFINDKIEECIFEGHPLGSSIIGTIDTLHSINRNKLIKYYHKYYRPDNLVIGLSGKLNNEYMKIIHKYIKNHGRNHGGNHDGDHAGDSGGDHSNLFKLIDMNKYTQGVSSIIPFVENYSSYRINCFPKSLTQDYINIIFKTKGYYDPNRYYHKLISNILGGNMSSRLFVEIREKLGLAYSVKCDITNYEEIGYFNIYTQNESKDTIKCIEYIFKELIKLNKHGIDETELNNNKKNYCDIYKTNFDDIEYENEFFCNQILFNKPIETLEHRLSKIQEITPIQLQNAANELFNFNKIHIITFGKVKKDKIEKLIKKTIKLIT